MLRTTVLFSLLLMVGCSSGVCPEVKEYTKEQQQAIVKSWNALPDDSPLQSPLNDWERMRTDLK